MNKWAPQNHFEALDQINSASIFWAFYPTTCRWEFGGTNITHKLQAFAALT